MVIEMRFYFIIIFLVIQTEGRISLWVLYKLEMLLLEFLNFRVSLWTAVELLLIWITTQTEIVLN